MEYKAILLTGSPFLVDPLLARRASRDWAREVISRELQGVTELWDGGRPHGVDLWAEEFVDALPEAERPWRMQYLENGSAFLMKPDRGRVKLYWSRSGINEDLVERDRCMVRDFAAMHPKGVVLQIGAAWEMAKMHHAKDMAKARGLCVKGFFCRREVQFEEIDK